MSLRISVVVPTYRRPALLHACLGSLLEQRFDKSEYEVIIVSDGPDAETEQVVLSFKQDNQFLRYLSLPKKRGPAAARNLGWKEARSPLIAFTDDDTVPCRDWLSAFTNAYTNQPVAFSGRTKVPLPHFPTEYQRHMARLQSAEFVAANCCCTKEALEKAGGFDERFTMTWGGDSDLQFKLLQQNIPIVKISEALVIHPVRPAPWGISIMEQKQSMYNALLYKKFPEMYRSKIEPRPHWEYYMMVLSFIILVIGFMGHAYLMAGVAFAIWGGLLSFLIYKRLDKASREPQHIAEMVVTSIAIPFLSLYWKIYGALKFRTLFL